jgi:glutamate synthase (ferredoxin)
MAPMATSGVEAVGSWARTLRSRSSPIVQNLLYDYFKQLFAQVTNPPIDCIPRGDRHIVRNDDRRWSATF